MSMRQYVRIGAEEMRGSHTFAFLVDTLQGYMIWEARCEGPGPVPPPARLIGPPRGFGFHSPLSQLFMLPPVQTCSWDSVSP